MTTTFVEPTYEQIATQLSDCRDQVETLAVERDNVRARFSRAEGFVAHVGVELELAITKAIAVVELSINDLSNLLTQKLAEPVDEKLGLGSFRGVAA